MTFSILGHCPRTGQFGVAMASACVAIARHCEGIAPNIGAALAQGGLDLSHSRLALNLLAQGFTPAYALQAVADNDPESDERQLAVLGPKGAVAATGPRCRAWAGHRTGDDFAALAEDVAGEAVVEAMAAAFAKAPDLGLDRRMLAALEAGRDAGGLNAPGGEMSAAVLVYGRGRPIEFFVRVDYKPAALAELRAIFDEYKLYEDLYRMRAVNPTQALTPAQIDAVVAKARLEAAGGAR